MKKYLGLLVLILLVATMMWPQNICFSALSDEVSGELSNQSDAFRDAAGFEAGLTVGSVVATVIKAFLGLLGIIFIVILVMAGYKWMTSGGNEEKIGEAKDMIRRAIIGLIITVSAYAITYFVFNAMDWVGGGGSYPL